MDSQIGQNRLTTLTGIKLLIIFQTIIFFYSNILIFTYFFMKEFYEPIILILSIIGILTLFILYIGFINIYNGKKEFGFNHEKSTIFARKLIIWYIVIYIIFSFFFSPYLSRIFLINSVVRTFIYALFLLALVYLIKDLTNDRIGQLLWIAFFSSFILGLISNVSSQIMSEFYDNIVLIIVIIMLIAAIIPSLLFIYCYYKTYKLLKIPKYNNEKNL